MKSIYCTILLGCIIFTTSAQNPIITSLYTADPSARVFNDTLYIYPSHDRDSAQWWDMDDWHVFSTVVLLRLSNRLFSSYFKLFRALRAIRGLYSSFLFTSNKQPASGTHF
jgi:hypothetical protein